jgi:ABC-type Zn uptake system ZnuABC Zn-binding protein ZnuA
VCRIRLLVSLALALPWAFGLGGPIAVTEAAAGPTPGKLSVVASTSVLADLVRQVGGEAVLVRPLAPAGADPHTFQPSPDGMRVLAQANVIFYNGSGLEEWWSKTVRVVSRGNVPIVELSKGLATLQAFDEERGPSHASGGGPDPHVWLDPMLAKAYVERIRDTLAQADPPRASAYADGAKRFVQTLDELDGWIRAEIAKIPPTRRKMVTFHNAFQYFAKRYGLVVRGYLVASPGKEPSAKALAELTRRVRQEQIPAVFAEADFSPKLVEALARDAGVKVVTTLYDGSLTSGPPADTYVNLMRHNVAQIVSALR